MRFRVVTAALVLASMVRPAPSCGASFDCSKATAADEHAVCADPRLSELDSLLGAAYAEAKRSADKEDAAKLLSTARAVLASRRSCGNSRPCLLSTYVGGLETYMTLGSSVSVPGWVSALDMVEGQARASRSLPMLAGQCVATEVASVTPRLEGAPTDFDSGTAVNFANGGHQVSYSREAALIASRPGDKAVMCLTAIPRNCPPGDGRGRFYTVTNLRTRMTWSLPDSQHVCGGA